MSPTVFGPAISAANVDQGELKSCWLACALAALAEVSPEQVRRLFCRRWQLEGDIQRTAGHEVMGVEGLGLYQMQLCVDGEWRVVTIDDYVPCMPTSKGRPAFTRNAAKGELWVVLLEKCFAKLAGSWLTRHSNSKP